MAIADALEKSPRIAEGDFRYMVVDDALATSWAKSLRSYAQGRAPAEAVSA